MLWQLTKLSAVSAAFFSMTSSLDGVRGDYPVHQRLLRRAKEKFWGIRYTNVFQAHEHSAPAVSPPERPSGEGQSCGPSVQDKLWGVWSYICWGNRTLTKGQIWRTQETEFHHIRGLKTHTHRQPDHTITLENTKIREVEHKWFERGVKEAIHIRALKPSLNRDGGRCNLAPIWNNIIKERLTESAMGTTNGGGAQSEESVSVPGRL